jgi:hypothetical protein
MPRPKGLSDADYERYERCVKKLKERGGVKSPYAVCLAAIRKGKS